MAEVVFRPPVARSSIMCRICPSLIRAKAAGPPGNKFKNSVVIEWSNRTMASDRMLEIRSGEGGVLGDARRYASRECLTMAGIVCAV